MFGQIIRRIGAASVLMASTSAAFANYACQGTIQSVSLNPSGVVTVHSPASGLGTFYICQIGSTTNGVGPEQCKAMLSLLYIARSTGQQVAFTFDDSLSCTTHPGWAWLTGWYYGPTLMD
jgi:hypothetical protein